MDLLRGRTGEKGGTKTIRRLILGAGTQAMQQLSGESTLIRAMKINVRCVKVILMMLGTRYQRHKLLSTNGSDHFRWPRSKDGPASCRM
jgi:hypothetical protein